MRLQNTYIISVFVWIVASLSLFAQDDAISFTMELSKDKLGINERIRVDFSMNKDGDNFVPPDFDGFRVVMGPSQSTSSSWINGVRSFKRTFSYTLQPIQKGTFTISQASVVIDGQEYKTQSREVVVSDAVKKPSDQLTAYDIAQEQLHLVAEISKGSPYLNEPISVVYKLYVGGNINVSNFRPVDNPSYENFWSQDIPIGNYTFNNEVYQGKSYKAVILKRVVLYPQKSGDLTIEPLSLEITADVPTNRRDFFGGVIYSSTNKMVSAGKRTIKVKPLPEAGKPESFSGAVGDYNFFVDASKEILNAGESLQLKVRVKGIGNLKLFQLPELKVPAAIEKYDPEFNESIKSQLSGMQGEVSNSYTLVPSYKGKFPIPALEFSYFNPATEKYHTLNSEAVVLQILEGPEYNQGGSTTTNNTVEKQAVATSNSFNFIKLETQLIPILSADFFGSNAFFASWLLPLLLIPLVVLFGKRREAIAQDVEGLKTRKANKLAKKYLSEAKKSMGDKEEFYEALERALHHFLKAKLRIETSEYNQEKITNLLESKSIDTVLVQEFIELLSHCDMARYSPVSLGAIHVDYDKSVMLITQLDKKL